MQKSGADSLIHKIAWTLACAAWGERPRLRFWSRRATIPSSIPISSRWSGSTVQQQQPRLWYAIAYQWIFTGVWFSCCWCYWHRWVSWYCVMFECIYGSKNYTYKLDILRCSTWCHRSFAADALCEFQCIQLHIRSDNRSSSSCYKCQ